MKHGSIEIRYENYNKTCLRYEICSFSIFARLVVLVVFNIICLGLKVPPMNHNELMELQQKAQFKYARYYHTSAVRRRRIRDVRIASTIAQTKAISALLESAPKLNEYDEV